MIVHQGNLAKVCPGIFVCARASTIVGGRGFVCACVCACVCVRACVRVHGY
eukprot:COSAG05_NODE_26344_length_189_cov_21.722222_1_plen_50_part_01